MPFGSHSETFVTDKRRTVDPALWYPIATEQNTNTTQTNPGDTGYIWQAMTPTWWSYSGKINKKCYSTFKIFPSPPGPQTDYMSSLCTRFIFSNSVLAVPEMSNHSARVATSQPEGGRAVLLQSLCHYHSAMLRLRWITCLISEFNKCTWMSELYLESACRYFSTSKAYGDTKDQAIHDAVWVITALAAFHPEQCLHISSFASNICLLTGLKLTIFGYWSPNTSI